MPSIVLGEYNDRIILIEGPHIAGMSHMLPTKLEKLNITTNAYSHQED